MDYKFQQHKDEATFELMFTNEDYQAALESAYKRDVGKYKVHGFRAGKAPRKMIEKTYGEGVFMETAIDELFKTGYKKILEDKPDLEPIAAPEIDFKIQADSSILMTGKVETIPQFKLGKYAGLEVKKADIKITDKEVTRFLDEARANGARQVEAKAGHKIAKGDIAVIDFTGSIDGVEFPGGKAIDHELEIGSNSFIDTFETQLVGLKNGDQKDVNVTFPAEYHATELAGKKAKFDVKVKNIMQVELPTLDDKFAKETSEFETLDAYKADIKAKLQTSADAESKQLTEDNLISTVVEQTKFDVPAKMIERQLDMMMNNINHRLAMQGASLELYAQMRGTTVEALREEHRPSATNTIKTRLILDAIAKKENIDVTKEEMEELVKTISKETGRKESELRKDKQFQDIARQNKFYDKITDFLRIKNTFK